MGGCPQREECSHLIMVFFYKSLVLWLMLMLWRLAITTLGISPTPLRLLGTLRRVPDILTGTIVFNLERSSVGGAVLSPFNPFRSCGSYPSLRLCELSEPRRE